MSQEQQEQTEETFKITGQSATAVCRRSYTVKDTNAPGQPMDNRVGEGSVTVSWTGDEPDDLQTILAANARAICARSGGWEFTVTDGVVEIHTPMPVPRPAPAPPQVPVPNTYTFTPPQPGYPNVPPQQAPRAPQSPGGFGGGQRKPNYQSNDVETLWADWSADNSGYDQAFHLAHPCIKPRQETLARLGIQCEIDSYGFGKALYTSSAPQWAKDILNGMGVKTTK